MMDGALVGVDLALGVIAACGALATAGFTRGLLRNDNARMQRKPLIIEKRLEPGPDIGDGWQWLTARVRNPESAGAYITAASTTSLWGRISPSDAIIVDDGLSKVGMPDLVSAKRKCHIGRYVDGASAAGATIIRLAVRGVKRADQVKISWNWADL